MHWNRSPNSSDNALDTIRELEERRPTIMPIYSWRWTSEIYIDRRCSQQHRLLGASSHELRVSTKELKLY
jgi:hypothetical protein